MEWISVKDKLPKDDTKVLVCESKFGMLERSDVFFGYYYGDKWHWENPQSEIVEYKSDQDMWTITHWMPLPNLPII